MKFISLGTKRSHRRGQLDEPSQATPERSITPMAVPHQIHTYAELRKQIHDDLRIQHPEWVPTKWRIPHVRFLRVAPHGNARRVDTKRIR